MSTPTKPENWLLSALPIKAYQLMRPKLEVFELRYTEIIYEPGDAISHIYFPESGIISLLSSVGNDSTIEVGIVGREGMIGLPVFLGAKISDTRVLVQGSGMALRMKWTDFLAESARSEPLRKELLAFTYRLMKQISQSAACNRFHEIEPRLARWLLMTQDRMRSDEFQITQDFLSNMLGVRREAVNKSAGRLQARNVISYSRGDVKVISRKKLELAACTCYPLVALRT